MGGAVPRVAGHGVGCGPRLRSRAWVGRAGRARAGRNSVWEMPREGCREDVCGCGCENPRGVAGVGRGEEKHTEHGRWTTDLFLALLEWRGNWSPSDFGARLRNGALSWSNETHELASCRERESSFNSQIGQDVKDDIYYGPPRSKTI